MLTDEEIDALIPRLLEKRLEHQRSLDHLGNTVQNHSHVIGCQDCQKKLGKTRGELSDEAREAAHMALDIAFDEAIALSSMVDKLIDGMSDEQRERKFMEIAIKLSMGKK